MLERYETYPDPLCVTGVALVVTVGYAYAEVAERGVTRQAPVRP